jgi:hypothetical protein
VPTWVAALGTVGTLFYGLRLLDLERNRVAGADGDARRSQASCLSAAIERRTDSVGRMAFPRPYRVVVISNASASPVYDVSALVCDDVGRSYVRLFWSVVRPGEEEKSVGYAPHLPDLDLLVDLWFKDAAGHLWRRDLTGALASGTCRPPLPHGFGLVAPDAYCRRRCQAMCLR